MKKLKKSVKALIISGVSVLCVLALVLGLVFGLRKPAGPQNPTNPTNPTTPTNPGAVDTYVPEKYLANYINSQASASIAGAESFDASTYVDSTGADLDLTSINEVTDEYIYGGNLNGCNSIYIKVVGGAKTYYKNLLDDISLFDDVSFAGVVAFDSKHLAVKYIYGETTSDLKLAYAIFDASDLNNVELLSKADVYTISDDYLNDTKFAEFTIHLTKDLYYVFVPTTFDAKDATGFEFSIFSYSSTTALKEYDNVDTTKLDGFHVDDTLFYFNNGNDFFIGYFNGTSIVSNEQEFKNITGVYVVFGKVYFEIADIHRKNGYDVEAEQALGYAKEIKDKI